MFSLLFSRDTFELSCSRTGNIMNSHKLRLLLLLLANTLSCGVAYLIINICSELHAFHNFMYGEKYDFDDDLCMC